MPVSHANFVDLHRAVGLIARGHVKDPKAPIVDGDKALNDAVMGAAGNHGNDVLNALKHVCSDGRLDLTGQPFPRLEPKVLNKLLALPAFWELAIASAKAGGHGGLLDVRFPDSATNKTVRSAIQHLAKGPTRALDLGLRAGQFKLNALPALQFVAYKTPVGKTTSVHVPKLVKATVQGKLDEVMPRPEANGTAHRLAPARPSRQAPAGRTSSAKPGLPPSKPLANAQARHGVEPSRGQDPSPAAKHAQRLIDNAKAHREYFQFYCEERGVGPELQAALLSGDVDASEAVKALGAKCAEDRMKFANVLADFEKEVGRQIEAFNSAAEPPVRLLRPGPPMVQCTASPATNPAVGAGSVQSAPAKALQPQPSTLSSEQTVYAIDLAPMGVLPPAKLSGTTAPTQSELVRLLDELDRWGGPTLREKLEVLISCHRRLTESNFGFSPPEYLLGRALSPGFPPEDRVRALRNSLLGELSRLSDDVRGLREVLAYYSQS